MKKSSLQRQSLSDKWIYVISFGFDENEATEKQTDLTHKKKRKEKEIRSIINSIDENVFEIDWQFEY